METSIAKIFEEENDFYSDDDLFKISSWGADLSFRELIERYQDNELIKPELQRKYVWDKPEASRFVETLLLGLPVPSIFLAKTQNEKLLIIDGYQRIMTVYDYVRGIFGGDNKVFKLSRSKKINKRWRGKAFSELSESEQRKIKNTTIHSIIFLQQKPEDNDTSLYQIFERINTSGRMLLPQEIRNCVYQGRFNSFLMRLNTTRSWRLLFGNEFEDQRMRDVEMILRFFALSSLDKEIPDQESVSLKKTLNQYMGENKNITDEEMRNFENRFIKSMNFIYDNLGEDAFSNLSSKSPGKYTNNFSPTIFDSISIATDDLLQDNFNFELENITERRIALLNNNDYKKTITQETMRVDSIKNRIKKVKEILYNAL